MADRTHYDVIVIGVGGMGSATVFELARRGQRVLGLERFDIPHELGSSHGITRMIRLAYLEHPSYVPLLRRSYELWRQLEARRGEQLLYVTGSVDASREDGIEFQGSLRSCQEHGLPHEVLDAQALAARFPGYELPAGHYGLLQPDGGFLLGERCIVGYVEEAITVGAEIRAREAVTHWEASVDGVVVETERGSYRAAQLVVTAGAWSSGLLPSLRGRATPERQVVGWFQPKHPDHFAASVFPVFNLAVDEGRYYGFPIHGGLGLKIGRYHHLFEDVTPDAVERTLSREDEEVLRVCLRRYFPAADGPTMMLKTCMFTNTVDEHFVIGKVDGVIAAAGFSGHGFKFCSLVGEVLADLVIDGETHHDIGMFDPARLAA